VAAEAPRPATPVSAVDAASIRCLQGDVSPLHAGVFANERATVANVVADLVTWKIDEPPGDCCDHVLEIETRLQAARPSPELHEQVSHIPGECDRGDIEKNAEEIGPRRGAAMEAKVDIQEFPALVSYWRGLQAADDIVDLGQGGGDPTPMRNQRAPGLRPTLRAPSCRP
jgi:hypothetical protein